MARRRAADVGSSLRRSLALLLIVGAWLGPATAAGDARLPGAVTFKACAGAGPYWPTMTLALDGRMVWVACKEQARVIRVDTQTRRIGPSLNLGRSVTAVAAGFGSIWALASGSTLTRIDPATGRAGRHTSLPVSAGYNIWLGGGSVWVADDQAPR